MAQFPLTPGWLYFLREKDYRTLEFSSYVKVGIVRASDAERFDRGVEDRIKEHQTGNPRTLVSHAHVRSHMVERVETLMHRHLAVHRIEGEWFDFSETQQLNDAIDLARSFALEAEQSVGDFEQAELLAKQLSIDPSFDPPAEILEVHKRLSILKAALTFCDAADRRKHRALNELGGQALGVVRQVERKVAKFDLEGFAAEFPDIIAEFTKPHTSISQRFSLATSQDAGIKAWVQQEARDVWDECARGPLIVLDAAENGDVTGAELNRAWHPVTAWQATTQWEIQRLEAAVKRACGLAQGITGVCDWRRVEKTVDKLDKAAMRKAHKQEYEKHTTTTVVVAIEQLHRQAQGDGNVADDSDEDE